MVIMLVAGDQIAKDSRHQNTQIYNLVGSSVTREVAQILNLATL